MIRFSARIVTAAVLVCGAACSHGDGGSGPDKNAVATVEVSPSQATITTIGGTQQLSASARNSQGTVLSGKTFSWSSSANGVATVSSGGLATAVSAGTATITATVDSKSGSAEITVRQDGTHLVFSVQPSTTAAGQGIAPAVKVEVRDAQNLLVTASTATVALALGANPGSTTLTGGVSQQAVGGVATFSGLSMTKAATGYTLAATSSGLQDASSQAFDIIAGPVAKLSWVTQPVDVQVLDPMPDVKVKALDTYDNPAGGATVTVSIGHSFDDGRTLDADINSTALLPDGVATFTNVKVRHPGPGYTLKATAGTVNAESAAFDAHAVFDAVVVGGSNTYGIPFACGRSVHAWYCWGPNYNGQLGSSAAANVETAPYMVNETERYIQVDLGKAHGCGRVNDGSVYCWGANFNGETGVPGVQIVANPTKVPGTGPGGLVITRISAGGDHTCGLATDQAIYCWGRNDFGQLGDGTTTDRGTPTKVVGSGVAPLLFVAVEATDLATCGIVNVTRAVYCWGDNSGGILGDGTQSGSLAVVKTQGTGVAPLQFASLTSMFSTMCGLTSGMVAYCWGSDLYGQLGDGSPPGGGSSVPVQVTGVAVWSMMSAGISVGCGVSGGQGYCWGRNVDGELGNGGGANTNVPIPVAAPPGATWASILAGALGVCGLTTAGAIYCWGDNEQGFVGDGTFTNRTVPTRVIQ